MNLTKIYMKRNNIFQIKYLTTGMKLLITKHITDDLMNLAELIPIGSIVTVGEIKSAEAMLCIDCKKGICVRVKYLPSEVDFRYYSALCCYEVETLDGRKVV
jgi:hypothetical protein